MQLFLHELRAQQLLFWRNREAAFFSFLFPIILLVLLGSVAASLLFPKRAETGVEVQLPENFDSPFDDDVGRLGAEEPPA